MLFQILGLVIGQGKSTWQDAWISFSRFCISLTMGADEPPVSHEVGSLPKMPNVFVSFRLRELRTGALEASFVCRQP